MLVRAAVNGLGLDLDEDVRVDEVDLHDGHRGPDVAKNFAVDDRDTLDVGGVANVDARHDHIPDGAAEVLERRLHGLDRGAHLLDDVIGHDAAVGPDPRRSRNAHHRSVAECPREPELELAAASGGVRVTVGVIRIPGGHQLRIRLITASANSFVPTADGSSRFALRSYVASLPSATTDAMARSSRSPASRSPVCRSMSTRADR